MMSRPFPVFCRDCKHSRHEKGSEWNLKCHNPLVNAKDPWALSCSKNHSGTSCLDERRIFWFAICGTEGKLWEPKASE
jgi:hypothetical protein